MGEEEDTLQARKTGRTAQRHTGNRNRRRVLAILKASSPLGRVASVIVSAFLAFCTTVGTIYRESRGSISQFGPRHWLLFALVFAAYEILLVTATAAIQAHEQQKKAHLPSHKGGSAAWARWVERCTHNFRSLWLFYLLALLWVPLLITLLVGADYINQGIEADNWICARLLHGVGCTLHSQDYPPADIYPIAHYLWPTSDPNFLTNQHNLFLTLLVGGTRFLSCRLWNVTWPADAALIILSYLFATFALAAMASRLVRLHPAMGTAARSTLLLLPVLSPMISLDTVSLTKSPQFAFAFAWWLSTLVLMVKRPRSVTRRDCWALAVSTLACLVCVKYALALILIELAVLLFCRHKQWKRWLVCLLLPAVLFSGALHAAYASRQAVSGDPIESRAVLVQQIARIDQEEPATIPPAARKDLSRIFNLRTMARLYNRNDADPVKSSGMKEPSYLWRTVSRAQWEKFLPAWRSVVRANPRIAFDAFAAEFYGYFDLADPPYVSFLYYSDNRMVDAVLGSFWATNPVRTGLIRFFRAWCAVPVLEWPLHGNFWVVLTLLAVCICLRLRRWTDFWLSLPLLAQMGVMALAPANNFDRHMIPLAVFAVFLLLDLVLGSSHPESVLSSSQSRALQN